MPRWTRLAGLGVLFGLLLAARAVPAAMAIPELPYTRFTLPNGLTVVVHEDHKAPVVAVSVWYHVGSADEPPGKSGFAHLFEHLMFSGSEHHRGSYFQPFERIGVTDMNGTTWFDRTNYFETVPKTALDLALWMESDRMGHLLGAIGQRELDTQRGVVQNEKRQDENQPYGRVDENILAHLFPANHPYHHDTIGSMTDLDAASLDDVKQWFKTYYGPANTTLVLAGDLTVAQARDKAMQYFADISPAPPVLRQQPWVTPLDKPARGIQHDQVAQVRLYRSWVVPQLGTPDAVLLDLATTVLGGGKTSRLYQRLVYRDRLADDVSMSIAPFALAGFVQWQADVKQGIDPARLEQAVQEEIARFMKEGPTQDELERARLSSRAGFIRGLEKVGGFGGQATVLAEGQVYRNDPVAYRRDFQMAQQATAKTVAEATRHWLGYPSYTLTVQPAGKDFEPGKEDPLADARPALPGRPQPIQGQEKPGKTVVSAIDRSKGVPQVNQFPDLTFPHLEHARLTNGIPVILAQRHAMPLTRIAVLFDAGYAADQGGKLGTAAFTTRLMNESTRQLDSVAVTEHKQRLGAMTAVGCDLDSCTASLDALNEQLAPSLALFASIVQEPAFKAEDIERVRGQWLAGIAQEKTQPVGLALRLLPPLLYGPGHAYGIPLTGSGTEVAIRSLQQADLRSFQQSWLRPDNAHILVAGDTTLGQIMPLLEQAFGHWQASGSKAPPKNLKTVVPARQARILVVDRPGSPQSLLLAGLVASPAQAPDDLALRLANQAFGGSFLSRLNMNLREDKHWAYGARSMLLDARGQRPLLLYAPVQADKTAESAAEVRHEIAALLGKRPLEDQEITRAKEQQVRSLPGKYETTAAVLGEILDMVTYGRPDDYIPTLKAHLEAVTTAQAQAALAAILKSQALTWVVVGDRAHIEAPLRKLSLGQFQLLDADGKPLTR